MRGAHQGVPVAALPGSPAGGLFSGLFGGNAPTPHTAGAGAAGADPSAPAIRRARAAPASTAGCSTICSDAAEISAARPRRARSARVEIHSTSVAQPIAATAAASGQALDPSSASDHRPAQRRRALLHEAEQRGGRARALRKRRHRAGDRLRQHHAEAGEIERHRQHQRGGGGQARARPPSPCRARRPPSRAAPTPRVRSSPSRITSRAASVVPIM